MVEYPTENSTGNLHNRKELARKVKYLWVEEKNARDNNLIRLRQPSEVDGFSDFISEEAIQQLLARPIDVAGEKRKEKYSLLEHYYTEKANSIVESIIKATKENSNLETDFSNIHHALDNLIECAQKISYYRSLITKSDNLKFQQEYRNIASEFITKILRAIETTTPNYNYSISFEDDSTPSIKKIFRRDTLAQTEKEKSAFKDVVLRYVSKSHLSIFGKQIASNEIYSKDLSVQLGLFEYSQKMERESNRINNYSIGELFYTEASSLESLLLNPHTPISELLVKSILINPTLYLEFIALFKATRNVETNSDQALRLQKIIDRLVFYAMDSTSGECDHYRMLVNTISLILETKEQDTKKLLKHWIESHSSLNEFSTTQIGLNVTRYLLLNNQGIEVEGYPRYTDYLSEVFGIHSYNRYSIEHLASLHRNILSQKPFVLNVTARADYGGILEESGNIVSQLEDQLREKGNVLSIEVDSVLEILRLTKHQVSTPKIVILHAHGNHQGLYFSDREKTGKISEDTLSKNKFINCIKKLSDLGLTFVLMGCQGEEDEVSQLAKYLQSQNICFYAPKRNLIRGSTIQLHIDDQVISIDNIAFGGSETISN